MHDCKATTLFQMMN